MSKRKWRQEIKSKLEVSYFLQFLERFKFTIGRVLTLTIVVVVISTTFSLAWTIAVDLFTPPYGQFGLELITVFWLDIECIDFNGTAGECFSLSQAQCSAA